MHEYKIIKTARIKQEKTRELEGKRGKTKTQTYTEVETFEDFYARTEKTLNDLANEGWQVISSNYSLPIEGFKTYMFHGGAGWSSTDFNSAEFVFVLQRSR